MKPINTQADLDEFISECQRTMEENKRTQQLLNKQMEDFYERNRKFSEEVTEIMTKPLRDFVQELKRL